MAKKTTAILPKKIDLPAKVSGEFVKVGAMGLLRERIPSDKVARLTVLFHDDVLLELSKQALMERVTNDEWIRRLVKKELEK